MLKYYNSIMKYSIINILVVTILVYFVTDNIELVLSFSFSSLFNLSELFSLDNYFTIYFKLWNYIKNGEDKFFLINLSPFSNLYFLLLLIIIEIIQLVYYFYYYYDNLIL